MEERKALRSEFVLKAEVAEKLDFWYGSHSRR